MTSAMERLKEIAAVGLEISEDSWAYQDGEWRRLADAKVSLATHALNYGTGIFEGIRAYWNEEQEQLYVFRLRDHFARMTRSCSMAAGRPTRSSAASSKSPASSSISNGNRANIE